MTTPESIVAPCICGKPNCKTPYGFCHCGCGSKTKIARYSYPRFGEIQGMPFRRICGHGNRTPRVDPKILGHFKLDGVYCRLIPLTKGQWSIVDEDDFEWIESITWYARYSKTTKSYYVFSNFITDKGKRPIAMHRFLLGLGAGDPSIVDHKDRLRTTENRRKNLRIVTMSQSNMNQGKGITNTSGRKGVSKLEGREIWESFIYIDGKKKNLGWSSSFDAACKVREEAEILYYGEYNCTD